MSVDEKYIFTDSQPWGYCVLAVPSKNGSPGPKWGQAIFVLLWVLVYDITIGPVTYCVVAEVSSTRLGGKTLGLACELYNVSGIASGFLNTYMMSPTAWNWKGYSGFFWFGSCVSGFNWSYFRLPECKGRTFRELYILFERKVSARRSKSTAVSLEVAQIG